MDFQKAISVASTNAKELLPEATSFTLEGAIVSDGDYEITLSYFLRGKDPLGLDENSDNSILKLAKIMGTRREYKTFIIDKNNFSFKGFKIYKER